MKAFDYIPLYSYEDYKLWEGDWELIRGYPYAMSPSPVRKHQSIVNKLSGQFIKLLEANIVCEVHSELDWIINDNTVVRPDVMIVCGEFKEDFLTFPPTLIVEVLSKSTSMKDRNVKYNLYQEQKVNYYILVEPETQTVEIFELQNQAYVPNNSLNNFLLRNNCNLQFDISAFVAALKL